jgi:hypothetical protein
MRIMSESDGTERKRFLKMVHRKFFVPTRLIERGTWGLKIGLMRFSALTKRLLINYLRRTVSKRTKIFIPAEKISFQK